MKRSGSKMQIKQTHIQTSHVCTEWPMGVTYLYLCEALTLSCKLNGNNSAPEVLNLLYHLKHIRAAINYGFHR